MKTFRFLKSSVVPFILLFIAANGKAQNAPIGCNGQYYVSHGPISGSTGNTLLEKLLFSGSTITASSFPLAPGSIGFNAMGLNPLDGYIYAVRYPAASGGDQKGHLLKIGSGGTNQTDLGQIAALNNGEIAYSGCFDANGDFYFTTTGGRFMKIVNPITSLTAVQIANTGFASFADIAINPVGGQMYGTTNSSTDWFFSINKSTGAITNIPGEPSLGGSNFFAGLFFDEVGQLFGYRSDAPFYLINKTNGALTSTGSANAYSGADGCSCSFGRVFHDLDFTQNPSNQICPTAQNPNPTFPLVVSVTNQSSSQQTGLTYTLNMVDPLKRFRFTESAATILSNLIAAGVATGSSTVTLTAETPAVIPNYNKVVVTGFQTGAPASVLNFTLQVQLVSLGGVYNPVPLQSIISGLPANLGSTDLSNDPTTVAPDDATVIIFCPNITLPARFGDFAVTKQGTDARLNWQTENEMNADHFEIERSYDGISFAAAGTKQAAGNSSSTINYQFTDPITISSGNIYYRLKTLDFDGNFSYSKIVVLRLSGGNVKNFNVYPNPFTSNLKLEISSEKETEIIIRISNALGQPIINRNILLQEGENVVVLSSELQSLKPGMHLLEIISEDGKLTQKIIKR